MSNHFENQPSPVLPQSESEAVTLLKKVQQQLGFLEKKIDILINRSPEGPSRGKHFSKPFRSFGHSRPHGRPEDGNRGFAPKKKPFFHGRKDRG